MMPATVLSAIAVVWLLVVTIWLIWHRDSINRIEIRLDNHKDTIGDGLSSLGYALRRLDSNGIRLYNIEAKVFPPPLPPKAKVNTEKAVKQIDGIVSALGLLKKQVKA